MSFVSKLNIRKVTVYECNEAPSNIVHEKISARHNGKLLMFLNIPSAHFKTNSGLVLLWTKLILNMALKKQ